MAARDVQVNKLHQARCNLGPWHGGLHPDYQGANAERQAHLEAHSDGKPCQAPARALTAQQQYTIRTARDLLAADQEGGAPAVVTATSTSAGYEPDQATLASPFPYAYGAATQNLARLLEVVDELAAEPEAGL